MNRALGEGKVVGMVKKYAYIQDERNGRVYFPLEAAKVNAPDILDLREKFQTDDLVIYTGSKQGYQNNCTYIANSVVKKKELITVTGKISELCDKFCYVEVKRYGRIFVPFSARFDQQRPWLGKGAERGREVTLKIFRQPDIGGCRYVAFAITLEADDSMRSSLRLNDGNVDFLTDQFGVICMCPPTGDCYVFSSHSGLSRLPAQLRKPWMHFGRFIRYEAMKQPTVDKVHWCIRKCSDSGEFYPIIPDPADSSKIYLECNAIVNRIVANPPNRCCWTWNDLIGRIYIPNYLFQRGIRVMECVKVYAHFTNQWEDVPWVAADVQLLGDDEAIRNANSQLLLTDDDWTVTFISNTNSFYGFMENPRHGQGFLAWTDIAEADPPPPATKCRATFYRQQRERKTQWRAVLLTPLNPNGIPTCPHPMYQNSGTMALPELLEAPVVESTQNSSAVSSPAPTMLNHFPPLEASLPSPIGAPAKTAASVVANKMNGHGPKSSHSSNGSTTEEPLPALSIADTSITLPSVFSSLSLGSPKCVSSGASASDTLSERNGSTNDATFVSMFANGNVWNGSEDIFSAWKPVDEATKDASTQTDMLVEQALLRDVFKHTELLKTILSNFPEHTANIMSMSAVWKH